MVLRGWQSPCRFRLQWNLIFQLTGLHLMQHVVSIGAVHLIAMHRLRHIRHWVHTLYIVVPRRPSSVGIV